MLRRLMNDRSIPAVYAVVFGVAAQALYEIEAEPGQQTNFDSLWAYVFAAGALLSVLYAVFPRNRQLAAWACAVMVGACVSRAWALFAGPTLTDARSRLGLSVWLGFGFALSFIWATRLMPGRDGE